MRFELFWRSRANLASPSKGAQRVLRRAVWLGGASSLAVALLVLQPGGQAGAGVSLHVRFQAVHGSMCQHTIKRSLSTPCTCSATTISR